MPWEHREEGHQREEEDHMKPRYKERISLKSSVMFSLGSLIGQGRVLDLTAPGCLIESPVVVTKGQYLHLKMFLPGLRSPLSVKLGAVRWAKGTQFGVEFIKMDESERRMLDRFMAHHLSDLASTKATRNSFSDPGGRNWHLETYSISKAR
jgi:hypothetical protein